MRLEHQPNSALTQLVGILPRGRHRWSLDSLQDRTWFRGLRQSQPGSLGLVAIAESGPLTKLQHAQVDLLRGQIAFALSRGSDALPLLLKAAKRFEPLDQRLARDTYLDALTGVFSPGMLASDESVLESAQAAMGAPPSSQPPHASDLLLDGLALLITRGYAAGTPTLRRAVDAFRREDVSDGDGRRWLPLAARLAAFLWDDEAWDVLSARFVQLARDAGALSVLPLALANRSAMRLFAGEFDVAFSLLEEVAAVNEATGASLAPYVGLAHVTFRGREAEATPLIEAATKGRRSGGVVSVGRVPAWCRESCGRAA